MQFQTDNLFRQENNEGKWITIGFCFFTYQKIYLFYIFGKTKIGSQMNLLKSLGFTCCKCIAYITFKKEWLPHIDRKMDHTGNISVRRFKHTVHNTCGYHFQLYCSKQSPTIVFFSPPYKILNIWHRQLPSNISYNFLKRMCTSSINCYIEQEYITMSKNKNDTHRISDENVHLLYRDFMCTDGLLDNTITNLTYKSFRWLGKSIPQLC